MIYLAGSLPVGPDVSCPVLSLVRAIPVIDSNVILLQLLQDDRSPFFGSFTRWPFFQSSGTLSCSQILCRSGSSMLVEVWISVFSASGGMPPGPAALPDFSDFMALVISYLVAGVNIKHFNRMSWSVHPRCVPRQHT